MLFSESSSQDTSHDLWGLPVAENALQDTSAAGLLHAVWVAVDARLGFSRAVAANFSFSQLDHAARGIRRHRTG